MKKIYFSTTFFTLIFFIYLILNQNTNLKIDTYLQSKTAEHLSDYDFIYGEYKKIANVIFQTTVKTPQVLDILKDLRQNDQVSKDKVRQKLYDHLKESYVLLKIYNVKQFHFHLPDNESFLRMHKPEKYGDNLTGIRQTVEYVNSTKKPIDGFEEGRHYNGFRFVFPIFYGKDYLGSVEVSFSTLAFSKEIMNYKKIPSKFLMLKKVTDRKLFDYAKGNYANSQFSEYYYEKQTDLDRKQLLKGSYCEVSEDTKNIVKLKKQTPESFSIFDEKSEDILTFLKIQNPVTKEYVALFVIRESGKYILEQRGYFDTVFFISTIFILLLFIFIYRLFYEKETLDQKVVEKTKELTLLNKKQEEYIHIIDQNIITSTTDLNGMIEYVSDAFCAISGYSKVELIGRGHNIIRHPDTKNEIFVDLWKTINSGKVWKGEIKNKRKNGSAYWVETTINPIFDESGVKIGYTSIRHDITDKKKIEEISITDGLTNIFNRRYFDDIFPKYIRNAKREEKKLCFVILDVDNFKRYNDTYGHLEGDVVLKSISHTIKQSLKRADDLCFRLGGEEFGIVFKAEDFENANNYINDIRINIENLHIEHSKNDASKFVTASFGMICKNPQNEHSLDDIYRFADEQLYEAKRSGRNRLVSIEISK